MVEPFWQPVGSHGLHYFLGGAPALPGRAQSEPQSASTEHWCCRGVLLRSSHRFRHLPKAGQASTMGPEAPKIDPKGSSKGLKNRWGFALIVVPG